MQGLSVAERDLELAPSEIQIYLFGPPRVEWHGQLLAIPRRQARALLYRLAAGDQPISRDGLGFLFWPDVGQATAGHNLSRLITIFHNTLPNSSLLIARDDQIGLHPQRTWSDTRALDQLWAQWARDGDASCLRQAIELTCGPFLDGFCLPNSPEFDTWASLERERWTRLGLQALAVLIETLAIDADYRGAIGYAERYLALDELAEDVHRRLIELYALDGNRSAALRQYERCVIVLERELGVSPTAETQAVYRAVLRGDGSHGCAGSRATMDRSRVAGCGDAASRTHRRPAYPGKRIPQGQTGPWGNGPDLRRARHRQIAAHAGICDAGAQPGLGPCRRRLSRNPNLPVSADRRGSTATPGDASL